MRQKRVRRHAERFPGHHRRGLCEPKTRADPVEVVDGRARRLGYRTASGRLPSGSEPIAPTCVEINLTYQDEGAIRRCEEDVRQFGEQVDDYLACIEQRIDELGDMRDALVERFACRAEGRTDRPGA